MTNMNKRKNGFTLIELLVVITVLGVLSGVMLGLINIRGIRAKSRDSQRQTDLAKVQTALELYFADYRIYPTSASWVLAKDIPSLVPNYISVLPTDPSSFTGTNPCGTEFGYLYKTDATGSKYVLTAYMEVTTPDASHTCSALSNCGGLGCSCGAPCYGIQNPL